MQRNPYIEVSDTTKDAMESNAGRPERFTLNSSLESVIHPGPYQVNLALKKSMVRLHASSAAALS